MSNELPANETRGSVQNKITSFVASSSLRRIWIIYGLLFALMYLWSKTSWLIPLHYFTYFIWAALLLLVVFSVSILWRGDLDGPRAAKFVHVLTGAILIFFAISLVSPSVADEHPVFKTPLSGRPLQRPSIMAVITDDDESYFTSAELYLQVSSSRFPNNTWLLFPLNVKEFSGCAQRFIQLPFEVADDDVLLFNLLDEDHLSDEEAKLMHGACQISGYCVWIGAKYYQPLLPDLLETQLSSAAALLGEAIVSHHHNDPYDNFGKGEHIVQPHRVKTPATANKTAILDDGYQRAFVKIYFQDRQSSSP